MSLERTEHIEQLSHTTVTNGEITGARSVYPKNNGNTGDISDTGLEQFWGPLSPFVHFQIPAI